MQQIDMANNEDRAVKEVDSNLIQNKPRILCLHGFRMSGAILKKLIMQWPEFVLQKFDLDFLDAPYPAQGKAAVEGIYHPPFFEWFQGDENFKEYYNFEECLEYLEDYMSKNGPFDGVLGFSQGAVLAAAFPGMQREGLALTKVPKLKFVIIISGAKLGGNKLGMPKLAANPFSIPLECPSLHFIGETDFLKEEGIALLSSFVDPMVIHYPEGHTTGTVFKNFDECIAYIEEQMTKLGPFDGVLGLSQGGMITATLPGMQREGAALTRIPRIKFVMLISAAKYGGSSMPSPELAKNTFSSPIDIPSLHIIGEKDTSKNLYFETLESYVHPTLLYHHEGHGVPHLGETQTLRELKASVLYLRISIVAII